jgi:hypothetical protein
MSKLIENILSGNLTKAKSILEKKLNKLAEEKISQLKSKVAFEFYGDLEESHNVQKLGRVKLIRARIRGGKVQRKKKLSNVKGYTMRGGHLQRISAQERQHRKLAAIRSKNKRNLHKRQSLLKRQISLRKRRVGI